MYPRHVASYIFLEIKNTMNRYQRGVFKNHQLPLVFQSMHMLELLFFFLLLKGIIEKVIKCEKRYRREFIGIDSSNLIFKIVMVVVDQHSWAVQNIHWVYEQKGDVFTQILKWFRKSDRCVYWWRYKHMPTHMPRNIHLQEDRVIYIHGYTL